MAPGDIHEEFTENARVLVFASSHGTSFHFLPCSRSALVCLRENACTETKFQPNFPTYFQLIYLLLSELNSYSSYGPPEPGFLQFREVCRDASFFAYNRGATAGQMV